MGETDDSSGRDFTLLQNYGRKLEIKRILARPRPTRSFKEEGTSYGLIRLNVDDIEHFCIGSTALCLSFYKRREFLYQILDYKLGQCVCALRC
jgi:hypothetical protein